MMEHFCKNNGQKPLTVFAKKAPWWMFKRVLNTRLRRTQNRVLIFSVDALYRSEPFFLRNPYSLFFNFCIIPAQFFDKELGLPCQRKRNFSPLRFPCESNLEDYHLLFLWHRKFQPNPFSQKIQKSNCSDSAFHPFTWNMSIANAIWRI